jgi:hypothetical protein
MRAKKQVLYTGLALLVAFSLAASARTGQDAAQSKVQADTAPGFKEFSARVAEYMKLRDSIEKKLPPLKSKEELPEMITAHQQALARKIREARPQAKPGDIFTHEAREAFRHEIRGVFQNPQTGAATARATTRQKDGGKPVRLRVNGIYSDAAAETTFPATLLQKLPVLPDELSYRIVGRNLVLVDKKANLVVDLLHEALP